ncbi:Alpha-D-kanosaminyltransferase [Botrimarina colliarenosi]|uniref:Alpha-D-kanosaminyltransferase n=1 Tax=Botrimarina colliarenosi TaxID=2528001 RepID=A0A5C6AEX7_9BACT|nr:glycosyltransferase [Botrimarina colliarenosi]TWT97611.1 Alpha-D-kanosaminyltransferase [Botrimarina colliarenosi]
MTRPLRVAYLTGMFGRPSDTFIRQEVNELRGLGVEVHTFSVRRPDAGPSPDADVFTHRSATTYLVEAGPLRLLGSAIKALLAKPLPILRTGRLALRTRAPGLGGVARQLICTVEAIRLAEQIGKLDIDLLHNHIGENSATVAMLAAELTGKPFSLTIHGPGVFYSAGSWALGEKLRRAAFTACISDFCRSQCMVFAPPEAWDRLHVVRCAVGGDYLAAIEESHSDPLPQIPTFVCVGRLCAEKAQRLLVEAAGRLVNEGRSLRIVLVGDGPEREAISAAIESAGLEKSVEVRGWMPSREIAALVRQSLAVVSCSFAEGLPIVLMEAFAARRAVVATHVGANYELVENEKSGWLIPPANVDALADALRAVLDASSEQLASYGEEGARRVTERHHPRRQAELLLALMQDAASRGR